MIDMRPREHHGRTQVTLKPETRDKLNRLVLDLSADLGYKISQNTAIAWLLDRHEEGQLAEDDNTH